LWSTGSSLVLSELLVTRRLLVSQQLEGIHLESGGCSFDRAKCEVSFTAFEATDVCSMPPKELSERLLRESAFDPITTQILSDNAL
jgi:hypothetical protein